MWPCSIVLGFCALLGAHSRGSETLKSRNSKWLPLASSEMRSPISLLILDRPTLLGRDFQRQYHLKRCRCLLITVSALTTIKANFHSGHIRESHTQKIPSSLLSFGCLTVCFCEERDSPRSNCFDWQASHKIEETALCRCPSWLTPTDDGIISGSFSEVGNCTQTFGNNQRPNFR